MWYPQQNYNERLNDIAWYAVNERKDYCHGPYLAKSKCLDKCKELNKPT